MEHLRLDFIIFGATGVTGKIVFEELLRQHEPRQIGIAGRNCQKLNALLLNSGDTERSLLVSVIEADVCDEASIASMCSRARVLINCVGPYRFYGEVVVRQAIANGASHIDICGEPEFLERIEAMYGVEAAERGVYVVGSCGFDSVPADLGVKFATQKFNGTLTGCESILWTVHGSSGYVGNSATWDSAIEGLSHQAELRTLRRKRKPIQFQGPRIPPRGKSFLDPVENRYCVPFIGSDRSVVNRTQQFLQQNYDAVPVHFVPYFSVGSYYNLLILGLVGGVVSFLCKFSTGKYLLKKFVRFFSLGLFSKGGPSQAQINETTFTMVFNGEGFLNGTPPTSDGKPDGKIKTLVFGPDPGYRATSIIVVECALTLLKDKDLLPLNGGVFTPGVAFEKTGIIDRLCSKGIVFKVI